MESMMALFSTLLNFLLVVVGFSFIIFIHELGHFLAARWAKIRVLAFAIGFGPAVVSYRPGLGLRRGSTEIEYRRRLATDPHASISPTEYRLNWIPFGGYVRMLGQEDGNPGAVSAESDSYQSCVPWKRMVVISAGVIMNVILAAILFVAVFNIGLPVLPPTIGDLEPGRPAATAVAINAKELGLTDAQAHLKPGDRVVLIQGERPNSFSDVMLAASMSRKGTPVEITVERPGVTGALNFRIVPDVHRISGLLDLGIDAPRSGAISPVEDPAIADRFAKQLTDLGFPGVGPGMSLVGAGPLHAKAGETLTAADFAEAFRASEGKPVDLVFAPAAGGPEVSVSVPPKPRLQDDLVLGRNDTRNPIEHLLGLTPVMMVLGENVEKDLLKGDIFARVGSVEFPSISQGMAEIQGNRGNKTFPITVLRKQADGTLQTLDKIVAVDSQGRIGFGVGSTADESTVLSRPPEGFVTPTASKLGKAPAAASLELRPGTRIIAIEDRPTATFAELRNALVDATRAAAGTDATARVKLTVELPTADAVRRDVWWVIPAADVATLQALGWRSPAPASIFEPAEVILRGSSPVEAIRLGLRETRRVMLQTYLTFARLFEGTVKVEHLQGPVGIAHIGTLIAEQGMPRFLFFLALISVNLAVVNFLPLPIVDGGQFLMLLYEQVRGRPLPIKVQEAVTVAGLIFIAAMFLLVTFNDVKRLAGF